MRRESAVSDGRALVRTVAAVAAALLVLGLSAAPAFGQTDAQYSAECQNIIGEFGVTQNQYANANATANGGGGGEENGGGDARAVARIAQEQGVSVAQVNECLNGGGERPGVRAADNDDGVLVIDANDDRHKEDVLAATIPDKVLPFTGGLPLVGIAALGLAAVGASVLMVVLSRRS